MKKILTSILTLGVVAVVAVVATQAFFSDTEVSTGNTITAGTIDISVDQNNPWSTPITISDMKPSYVRWTRHVVRNVGNNPLKLWKHIGNVSTENNGWSEEECSSQGGLWDGNVGCENPRTNFNNISRYIEYDVYLEGVVEGNSQDNWFGGQNSGGQVVISEEAGLTVHDVESWFVFLGTLEPNTEIVVWQSYHMRDETVNWAQTDQMTFDLEFYAEQVNGNGPTSNIPGGSGRQALLLENKDTSTFDPLLDGTWGVLKWAGDGNTFDFSSTFEAQGLTPGTNYSLIYYADPWPGNNPGALLGTGASDGSGNLTISANPNLGTDLPNTADGNHPTGAKIWLVLSDDYDSGAKSMTSWNPSEYLFEYTLMTYDDTDV